MLMVEIIHPQLGFDLDEMRSMIGKIENDYLRLHKLRALLEVTSHFGTVQVVFARQDCQGVW